MIISLASADPLPNFQRLGKGSVLARTRVIIQLLLMSLPNVYVLYSAYDRTGSEYV